MAQRDVVRAKLLEAGDKGVRRSELEQMGITSRRPIQELRRLGCDIVEQPSLAIDPWTQDPTYVLVEDRCTQTTLFGGFV